MAERIGSEEIPGLSSEPDVGALCEVSHKLLAVSSCDHLMIETGDEWISSDRRDMQDEGRG
jgi:hypothetical protein